MRPVERGHWPTEGSLPVQFKEYGDARPALLEQLGPYCSYCEMPIHNQPAVEHVQPKSKVPELELFWCNFLLACAYCNSTKGDQDVRLRDYFWPDQDNTFRAFVYVDGKVSPAPGLGETETSCAQRTIELTGLDKYPGAPRPPSATDRRWSMRNEAWGMARHSRMRLQRKPDNADMREQIVDTAKATGFWSIWMTVFADDADMRRRFIEAFKSTSPDCFDVHCQPLPRPCGAL
jgi:uncharacterized protein (TIGR02646 family)